MNFFRIVDRDGEMLADANSFVGVTEVVSNAPPGRYQVDEISAKPLPSGHPARTWGTAVRHVDGQADGP